jgi:hypothetical protein
MKISIITVCYNAAGHIESCLSSVAEQTWPDIEHVVVDGLSTDATVAIVRRYHHVTTLISEPDHGIYDAMNKGLDLISGDYVLFLNADDTLVSADALARAVAAIEADSGGDVYYGSLKVRPLDGPAWVFHPPPPAEAPIFMIWGCLPHQSTLARPAVFARTGRFDPRYRYHADYDWFLKVIADPAIDVRSVTEVIGSFQLGGASSQLATGQLEVYAIQNQSPLYATPEWDKQRIATLQEAFLRERLQIAQLKEELHTTRESVRRLKHAYRLRVGRSVGAAVEAWLAAVAFARAAPGVLRDTVRMAPRRLRWWTLRTCVRILPAGAVDLLRDARGRARTRLGRDSRFGAPTTDAAGDPTEIGGTSALAHIDQSAWDGPAELKIGKTRDKISL